MVPNVSAEWISQLKSQLIGSRYICQPVKTSTAGVNFNSPPSTEIFSWDILTSSTTPESPQLSGQTKKFYEVTRKVNGFE
jgi:hypothetical protein